MKVAFDDRSIRRGITIAEGDYVASQTLIERAFVREYAQSPVGPLPPNGHRIVWDLLSLYRFDDRGRLSEEWSRTDNRSLLRHLGLSGPCSFGFCEAPRAARPARLDFHFAASLDSPPSIGL